jgi:hypothetical protein
VPLNKIIVVVKADSQCDFECRVLGSFEKGREKVTARVLQTRAGCFTYRQGIQPWCGDVVHEIPKKHGKDRNGKWSRIWAGGMGFEEVSLRKTSINLSTILLGLRPLLNGILFLYGNRVFAPMYYWF